ncbi:hypothetical protein [Streptomyces sp. 16-176A]|uniref:hypothetical protein n=1 Tax=Streptomyces sp. 16-176A TaxID=2530458 RepID=UPI00345D149F
MEGHDERSKPGIGDLAEDPAENQVGFLMDEVGVRCGGSGCERAAHRPGLQAVAPEVRF